ncbi:MAG: hypothetical protein JSS50_05480 [Proteobacteria bacterium]|nr:hypothetical protein [Pseudomonadota bacterium]
MSKERIRVTDQSDKIEEKNERSTADNIDSISDGEPSSEDRSYTSSSDVEREEKSVTKLQPLTISTTSISLSEAEDVSYLCPIRGTIM